MSCSQVGPVYRRRGAGPAPLSALPILATLIVVALGAGVTTGAGPENPARPLPISAHNCYPHDGQGASRLAEALALGIDNIEIDVGWDGARRQLIVGHDARPRSGVEYPKFEAFLIPALQEHWKTHEPGGPPTVLTVDWKTAEPEAVRRFKAFLDGHADWFSSAPKDGAGGLTPRRLTVCLTGDEGAKVQYDALVPAGGVYRAFRDTVAGAGSAWHDDVAAYAPRPASTYHRFLTLYWGHVERGGPPLAGVWTDADEKRLRSLVELAHRQGYRLRVYTLNGKTGGPLDSYRFADEPAAILRWKAARAAGVDWVATDEYAAIVRVFQVP